MAEEGNVLEHSHDNGDNSDNDNNNNDAFRLFGISAVIGSIFKAISIALFESALLRGAVVAIQSITVAEQHHDKAYDMNIVNLPSDARVVRDRLVEALAISRKALDVGATAARPLEANMWVWSYVLEPIAWMTWSCSYLLDTDLESVPGLSMGPAIARAMISASARTTFQEVFEKENFKQSILDVVGSDTVVDAASAHELAAWLSRLAFDNAEAFQKIMRSLGCLDAIEKRSWRTSRKQVGDINKTSKDATLIDRVMAVMASSKNASEEQTDKQGSEMVEENASSKTESPIAWPAARSKVLVAAHSSDVSSPRSRASDFRQRMRRLSSHDLLTENTAEVECPERRLVDYFVQVSHGSALYDRRELQSTNNTFENRLDTLASAFKFKPKVQSTWPSTIKGNPLPPELPSFCFPCGVKPFLTPCSAPKSPPEASCFDIVLANAANVKLFGTCLIAYEPVSPSEMVNKLLASGCRRQDIPLDLCSTDYYVYLPRCICLMSRWPFFSAFRSFLSQIYSMCADRALSLPIERYIANFVHDAPVPPRGTLQVQIAMGDQEPIYVHRPSRNQLPLADFNFAVLTRHLGAENAVIVFTCLLSEARVAFCSSDISVLTPVCEAFRALLFPLQWQCMYIRSFLMRFTSSSLLQCLS